MNIGLMGSHRVGKTTLAQLYASRNNIELVITSASRVFKSLGADPKAEYDFSERLEIQTAILAAAAQDYKHCVNTFIADRTPLDMLAYTLADVQRSNLSPEEADLMMLYEAKCFEVTNDYFGLVVLIQPGIPIIEEEGKAPGSLAYMEHLNHLCRGASMDERLTLSRVALTRDTTELQARVGAIEKIVGREDERQMTEAKELALH